MENLNYMIEQSDLLLKRIFEEKIDGREEPWSYSDAVTIGLMNNLIKISKSIKILQNSGNHVGIESLLRVAFENYIYLKYIVLTDTENRAKAYLLSDRLFSIRFYELLANNSKQSKEIRKFLNLTKEEINEGGGDFSDKTFKDNTESQYQSCFSYNGKKPGKWYDFDGKTNNFEELCRKIDEHTAYFIVYRIFSRETHSAKAYEHFLIDEETSRVGLLDNVMDSSLPDSVLTVFLYETIRRMYKFYELKKYLTAFEINAKNRLTPFD